MIRMTTVTMRAKLDFGNDKSMPKSMKMVKKTVIMKEKMNLVT